MGSGIDVILENGSRLVVEAPIIFEFPSTNNQTEYKFVIVGITLTREMGA